MIRNCVDYTGNVFNGFIRLPICIGGAASLTTKTVAGVFGTVMSVATLGLVDKFNRTAQYTGSASRILPTLYRGVLGIVNSKVYESEFVEKEVDGGNPFKENGGKGFFRSLDMLQRVKNEVDDLKSNPSNMSFIAWVITDNIHTRVYYALAAVIDATCRIADFILGVGGAVISIIFLGRIKKLNIAVMRQLTVFGAIDDLSRGIRGFINPWQNSLEGMQPYGYFNPRPTDLYEEKKVC
jgi:hypothetical protein